MGDQSIVDKTMRSVFVGNIPYEVSEEKLKDIFSEVGPVLSFKLVFDRDSGKPKGYGFCEYKDQETALSAMRNLNNYEIAGRNLRVDNACTEKSRLEMQSLMQSAQVESTYGEPVMPEKVPEVIGKAIASLPPEQLYELMKQMKHCIQSNTDESRQLLLQNPQLAYALLQAMVLMKVVDMATALTMLHPASTVPPVLTITSTASSSTPVSVNNVNSTPSTDVQTSFWNNTSNKKPIIPPSNPGHLPSIGTIQPPPMPPLVSGQDMDMRASDINMKNCFADQDMRIPSMTPFSQVDVFSRDPRLQQNSDNVDLRHPFQGLIPPPGIIPPPNMPLPLQMNMLPNMPNMPRMMPPPNTMPHPVRAPIVPNISNAPSPSPISGSSGMKPPILSIGGSDNEKAALIMQVLQLTEEQIAMLPTEQRQSILVLKEQIAKSAKR